MNVKISIRFLAAAAVLLALSAPAAGANASAPADLAANKQLMNRMIEDLWNAGHLEACDDLFVKEGVLHYRGHQIPAGPAECRQSISKWREALENFHFSVQSVVAEGDLVSAYLTFTGKQVKPLLGVAPSGKDVKVEEVLLVRIAGGRIVELWELYDEYAFRRETGDIPAPAPQAAPAKP